MAYQSYEPAPVAENTPLHKGPRSPPNSPFLGPASRNGHGVRDQLDLNPDLSIYLEPPVQRLVCIRYFMTVTPPAEGSLVKWYDAPLEFNGVDLKAALESKGISLANHLAQVYEPTMRGFANLDPDVVFTFLPQQRALFLNVRLTPLNTGVLISDQACAKQTTVVETTAIANPGSLGLFAFALTTGFLMLEVAGAVESGFVYTVAPCALMYGGLVQLLVGMWEIKRNNLFGAAAFTSYGAFWMIFFFEKVFFSSKIFPAAHYPKGETAYHVCWGLLTSVFFVSTLRITLALQVVFFLVAATFFLLAGGDWSAGCKKAAGIVGFLAAASAFYTGAAEFSNDLAKKVVLPLGHFGATKKEWGNSAPGAGAVLIDDQFGIVGLRARLPANKQN